MRHILISLLFSKITEALFVVIYIVLLKIKSIMKITKLLAVYMCHIYILEKEIAGPKLETFLTLIRHIYIKSLAGLTLTIRLTIHKYLPD